MSGARSVVLTLCVAAGAVAAGFFSARPPEPIETVRAVERLRIPSLDHPGLQTGVGVKSLVNLGLMAPPEPVAQTPGAPPPPDIGDLLRRDLTAVVRNGNRRSIWVVDRENNETRRLVRPGQVYRDGWILSRITAQEVVLRRDEEIRRLSIMSLEAAKAEMATGGVAPR